MITNPIVSLALLLVAALLVAGSVTGTIHPAWFLAGFSIALISPRGKRK